MTTPAIEIQQLSRRLGGFALDRVDLTLPTGYVMGLVGPNGSGKTSTIKAALGMLRADSGRLGLLGRPAGDPEVRQRVGIVLDEPFLSPDWTVASVGPRIGSFYRDWDPARYADLMARLAVPTTRKVADLSRGEGMKLMLALALSHHPELLVLDEPTSGLDPVSRVDVIDMLRDFMTDERHSILFSTHITTDLTGLADHLQVMRAGRVVHTGTLDGLAEEFAMVRGTGRPTPEAAAALLGHREAAGGFDGLIRLADSHRFGPDAVIDEATIDDVVVHLALQGEEPAASTTPATKETPATNERTSA